jgi:hypothetical protein
MEGNVRFTELSERSWANTETRLEEAVANQWPQGNDCKFGTPQRVEQSNLNKRKDWGDNARRKAQMAAGHPHGGN